MIIEFKQGLKPSYPTRRYLAFSIYLGKHDGIIQRLYSIYEPNDGLAGFDVVSDSEIDVIDPSLDNYILIPQGCDKQTIVHKAAYPSSDFYEELMNHDDLNNIETLFQNMRDMGLKP